MQTILKAGQISGQHPGPDCFGRIGVKGGEGFEITFGVACGYPRGPAETGAAAGQDLRRFPQPRQAQAVRVGLAPIEPGLIPENS